MAITHSASSNLSGTDVAGLSNATGKTLESAGQTASVEDRGLLLKVMRRGLPCNALALLVACSGLLSVDDYNRLNGVLWNQCLDNENPFIQVRVRGSSWFPGALIQSS